MGKNLYKFSRTINLLRLTIPSLLVILFANLPNCYATENNEEIEGKEYALLREKVVGYNYGEMKKCLYLYDTAQ